jgi:hypothetical protein
MNVSFLLDQDQDVSTYSQYFSSALNGINRAHDPNTNSSYHLLRP